MCLEKLQLLFWESYEHINTLRRQNDEYLTVKFGGTYINHFVLKGNFV
jgi:hypothetical protein